MEHDKGVHTHAAWDLIRAQSQPQEHLKEGGKMVDFAGGHFLCHGRSVGGWFQALCFRNQTWQRTIPYLWMILSISMPIVAPCCTFIGISRLISHVWLPEGTVPVLFGGYAMPVQYEAKGSKHALSIIDSTKWTRVLSQLVAVARLKVRLNFIANGELQIKNYRQNVKDFDQSSDRFLASLLLFT